MTGMTPEEFQSQPDPKDFPLPLQALWKDAKGQWDEAHDLAQRAGSRDGDWVHAYLHRKEGDAANAGYWYRRAGRPIAEAPFETEWAGIVDDLLRR